MQNFFLNIIILYNIISHNSLLTSDQQKPFNTPSFQRILTQKESFEIESILNSKIKFMSEVHTLQKHQPLLNQFGRKKLEIKKNFLIICDEIIKLNIALGIDNFNNSSQSTELLSQAKNLYAEQLMLEDIIEDGRFKTSLTMVNNLEDQALDDLLKFLN